MITKRTVFVLGAGASHPYGYPSGRELLQEIFGHLGNSHWISFLSQLGVQEKAITSFRSQLYLSQQPSVDTFLEHRREFSDIGKLSIALALMTHEVEENLFGFSKREVGFYHYLFTQLNTGWEEFGNNQLSIITFNYDRSLEHYLFTALKNTYARPSYDKAQPDEFNAQPLSKIPIIHVHGSLGPLPWQEEGGRPYSELLRFSEAPLQAAKDVETASKGILIVSEAEHSTAEFNRAFDCLKSAERIYFLGFGYHIPNLVKLGLGKLQFYDDSLWEKYRGTPLLFKPFRGSALGLGAAQRKAIVDTWHIGLPDNSRDDLSFLKEYAELN